MDKTMQSNKNIYRFILDYGRSGCLRGMFTATQAEVDAAMGRQCYFGEVLGKHSEVVIDLGPEHVTKVDGVNDDFVMKFEELGLDQGINPLDYAECPECNCPEQDGHYDKCSRDRNA